MKHHLNLLVLMCVPCLLSGQLYDDEQPRSPVAASEKCILFGDDFETGCWDTSNPGAEHPSKCPGEGVQWKHAQLQGPHAITYVNHPVRSGNYAVRFKWMHMDPGRWEGDSDRVSNNEKKAMLHAPGVKNNPGSERWYGFSVYFPSDGMKRDGFNHLFFQLHATPDHDLGEPWRQPPAAMTLTDKGLKADWTWDSARISPRNSNIVQNRTTLEIPGKRDQYLDRWVDIVWHVRVDPSGTEQGLIRIWVDGEQVADYRNIRFGYNDERGLYPSYGMYWYQGKAEHDHWVYVDEVRIGGPSCSYKDVAPRSADPEITDGFYPDNVPLYDAFEMIALNDKEYSNKFDFKEIELQATFTSPSSGETTEVYGFYDGDGLGGQKGNVWRLRFMPTETGQWHYTYRWSDGTPGGAGSFICIPSDNRGPLQIDPENPWFFRTMNGGVFHARPYDLHQVGPMGSVWGPSRQPGPQYRGTDWSSDMDDVHAAIMDDYMVPFGYNLTMLGSANHEDYPPTYWQPDTTRFNISVWKVTENVYLHARRRGIYCFQFDGMVRIRPVKTVPTLHRWNEQLVRYYCARLSSISSHLGFNPTRENYKLPRRGYSKTAMNDLMTFCKASIPGNYNALLTIHDNMYSEFAGWQDFAIRQHPSRHVEGNSKESQQGNNNDRGVDVDSQYAPYDFPVIGAEDVWEGLTQEGVAECIRPVWGQLMAGIIPLYSEWNRWIEVQGTGVAEEPYRKGLDWWYERVQYRDPEWRKMNGLVSSDNPYEIGAGIPGREYVAYREGNGPVTIDLTGVTGTFDVSFYDPFTGGRHDRIRVISGGGPVTFSPPFSDSDVVVLLEISRN